MFTTPFATITSKTEKKLTLSLFYLLIIGAIVLVFFNNILENNAAPYGIFSFELAGSLNKSLEILNSWSPLAKIFAGLSLGFDFLFLLIYTLFISLLIHKINKRLWLGKPFHRIGELLVWSMCITAIFDAIENAALIKLLVGSTQEYWSYIAYTFAVSKFILISIAIIYIIFNSAFLLFKKTSKIE